jgi:hypothetical protein
MVYNNLFSNKSIQEPSYISPGGDTVITKRKNEAYIKKHRINRNSVANTKGKY